MIVTNVGGNPAVLHKVLITGSIAGWVPGSFQAVYNATKVFVDDFSAAIRNEQKEAGASRSPPCSQGRSKPNSSSAPG